MANIISEEDQEIEQGAKWLLHLKVNVKVDLPEDKPFTTSLKKQSIIDFLNKRAVKIPTDSVKSLWKEYHQSSFGKSAPYSYRMFNFRANQLENEGKLNPEISRFYENCKNCKSQKAVNKRNFYRKITRNIKIFLESYHCNDSSIFNPKDLFSTFKKSSYYCKEITEQLFRKRIHILKDEGLLSPSIIHFLQKCSL